MAEQQVQQECVEETDLDSPGYKPPAPMSVKKILELDNDDESLKKYKEKLMPGAAGGEPIVIDESNASNVILQKLAICVEGRKDIELDLTLPVAEIKETTLVLKENCEFRVKIFFYVQREIVTGLRYEQKVKAKFLGSLFNEKTKEMVGSYAPNKEMHVFTSPVSSAPGSKSTYSVHSLFTDDDGHSYLKWEWKLAIKKDFE